MNHFDELIAEWKEKADDMRYDPKAFYVLPRHEIMEACISDLKTTLLLIEADKIRGIK